MNRVISFNYDDLLEVYLRYYGYTVASVAELPAWERNADVSVLHPHGLLPHAKSDPPQGTLILTQASFDKLAGRLEEMWTRKVLDVFESHFCLFVGLSGNNKNLSSLLSNTKHPTKDLYWGIRFTDNDADPKNFFWEKRKVYPKVLSSYDDLPTFLFRICQKAAELRME